MSTPSTSLDDRSSTVKSWKIFSSSVERQGHQCNAPATFTLVSFCNRLFRSSSVFGAPAVAALTDMFLDDGGDREEKMLGD